MIVRLWFRTKDGVSRNDAFTGQVKGLGVEEVEGDAEELTDVAIDIAKGSGRFQKYSYKERRRVAAVLAELALYWKRAEGG
jgi:hypothetical protein